MSMSTSTTLFLTVIATGETRSIPPPTNSRPIVVGRASNLKPLPPPNPSEPSTHNLIFNCPVMSKRHAELTWSNQQVFIKDTNSTHGTWLKIDGDISRLAAGEPTKLETGMVVRFGKVIGTGPEDQRERHLPIEVSVKLSKLSSSGTYGLTEQLLESCDEVSEVDHADGQQGEDAFEGPEIGSHAELALRRRYLGHTHSGTDDHSPEEEVEQEDIEKEVENVKVHADDEEEGEEADDDGEDDEEEDDQEEDDQEDIDDEDIDDEENEEGEEGEEGENSVSSAENSYDNPLIITEDTSDRVVWVHEQEPVGIVKMRFVDDSEAIEEPSSDTSIMEVVDPDASSISESRVPDSSPRPVEKEPTPPHQQAKALVNKVALANPTSKFVSSPVKLASITPISYPAPPQSVSTGIQTNEMTENPTSRKRSRETPDVVDDEISQQLEPRPIVKKARLGRILPSVKSVAIFALGSVATVAGILAFENVPDI